MFRIRHGLMLAALLGATIVAHADERTAADQRSAQEKKEKKEQHEKKGALEEKADPAKDARLQKANIRRLERNAEIDRANGNRVGAWAAERDAKHARKLLEKDQKLMEHGEEKQQVDGQAVRK
jgi:tRNA A37 N6-isopentenylltransferase MiaA